MKSAAPQLQRENSELPAIELKLLRDIIENHRNTQDGKTLCTFYETNVEILTKLNITKLETQDLEKLAEYQNNVGNAYIKLRKFTEAIECYKTGLQCVRKLELDNLQQQNNSYLKQYNSDSLSEWICQLQLNMGKTYITLNNHEDAFNSSKDALQSAESLNREKLSNVRLLAKCHCAMGNVYNLYPQKQAWEYAIKCYITAIGILNRLSILQDCDWILLENCQFYAGTTYKNLDQFDQSQEQFIAGIHSLYKTKEKSEKIFSEIAIIYTDILDLSPRVSGIIPLHQDFFRFAISVFKPDPHSSSITLTEFLRIYKLFNHDIILDSTFLKTHVFPFRDVIVNSLDNKNFPNSQFFEEFKKNRHIFEDTSKDSKKRVLPNNSYNNANKKQRPSAPLTSAATPGSFTIWSEGKSSNPTSTEKGKEEDKQIVSHPYLNR